MSDPLPFTCISTPHSKARVYSQESISRPLSVLSSLAHDHTRQNSNRQSYLDTVRLLLVGFQCGWTMPFFDFAKPEMFNFKKRIGVLEKFEDSDSVPESWVELAPSRTSLCSSVDASMVSLDEHKDKDSRLSPVSVQSPHVEFDNLEQVKYRLVRDMLSSGKNTDWIWDWSSRPEAYPPKCVHMKQYGSNLTTPPNSPEPELTMVFAYDVEPKSMPLHVVVGFVVSNIVTFVIGAAIGFAICKRLVKERKI